MFPVICARINGWVNNSEAGDLRRHRGHYDVNVMWENLPITMGDDTRVRRIVSPSVAVPLATQKAAYRKSGKFAMPETCENWLDHVNNCVYYARQTREIYHVLPNLSYF